MYILKNIDSFFFNLFFSHLVFDFIRRNESFSSITTYPEWRVARQRLVEVCLILSTHLPPYVILEIFDWLDEFHRLPHSRKIKTIIGVHQSVQKLGK